MLDQLIESNGKNNEKKSRAGYLLTSLTAVLTLCSVTLAHSLYNYNLGMTNESLDAASLVAPVPITEEAPKLPEEIKEPKAVANASADKLPVRAANIQRLEETPINAPTDISTVKNSSLARPVGKFELGKTDAPGEYSGRPGNGVEGNSLSNSVGDKTSEVVKEDEKDEPPVIKKAETKPEQKTIIRSGGVVNGKALKLVTPAYPVAAKAVRAAGSVNVQVLIDEEGNVVKASAVTGHALLRQAAEQAARASKFSSTILTDQKVKVSGIIVYNFVAQ